VCVAAFRRVFRTCVVIVVFVTVMNGIDDDVVAYGGELTVMTHSVALLAVAWRV